MRDIRFLLDEHIDPAVATSLRRRGIDVLTARDAGLLHAPDTDYIRLSIETARVIVTFDGDFPDLHGTGVEHAGIVFCPAGKHDVGRVVNGLVLVYEVYTAAEMRNYLEYL